MKAIKFLTIALALTAMQTVQAADNLNGKDNGTTIVQPTTEYYYVGDVDGNGVVNMSDANKLMKGLNGWDGNENYSDEANLAADIDGNGIVNMSDLNKLLKALNGWEGYEQYLVQREKPTLH